MSHMVGGMDRALLLPAFLLAAMLGGVHGAFNRSSFPKGFIFGTASSAIQGAVDLRGKNIWDTFAHTPGKIDDGSNPDIGNDFYHRYKEQLKLITDMNMDTFRFSISWCRILPSGGINKAGVDFYNSLINEVIARGLVPFVTIFHFDTPQVLVNKYGGFLSENIVKDYVEYAELCFKLFGDRVKFWTTFNEPMVFSFGDYIITAPGRCSPYDAKTCGAGDAATEPYIVGHNLLIAHAEAVCLYRAKYQAKHKGQIGITQVSHWFVPYSDPASNADLHAVKRSLDLMLGWFMHPITFGEYPATMRRLVGNRLPEFTEVQLEKLKKSFDFLGINYYTSFYAKALTRAPNRLQKQYITDSWVNQTGVRHGVPICPVAHLPNLFNYPPGLRSLLLYLKRMYGGNTPIYITENGTEEGNIPIKDALNDRIRIIFHYNHLKFVRKAIQEGVNVKGYFTWTFMDCFEFGHGFNDRYGLIYVDRVTLKTYRKKSSYWIENFLKK